MDRQKLNEITGDYQEWLINSLKDKKEAAVYLQVALDEYHKDSDTEALLLALCDVAFSSGIEPAHT